MNKNNPIYKKYKDISFENQKTVWRSRSDSELIKYQIILNDNPVAGFKCIYNDLVSSSYQIQWVPIYFWKKNIKILENEINKRDYDALMILEELHNITERANDKTLWEEQGLEYMDKIFELYRSTRGIEHEFREYKFDTFELRNNVALINSNLLSDSAKQEIFLLFEEKIISDLNEDSIVHERMKVLSNFEFFRKNFEKYFEKYPNEIKDSLFRTDVGANQNFFEEIFFNFLNNKNSEFYSKYLSHFLFSKRDFGKLNNLNKLISEYDKKVFSDKYYFDSFRKMLSFVRREDKGGSVPTFLYNIVYKYILKIDITDGINRIINSFDNFYFLFDKNKYPEFSLEIEKKLVEKNHVDKFVKDVIKSFSELYSYNFNQMRQNKKIINNYSTKIIAELLRILFSQRSLLEITHLLNGGYLNKKSTTIAQKLIEEALMSGDPVAMECLSSILYKKNHTKKMLNILVYHMNWNSEQAVNVVEKLLSLRGSSGHLEREISDFLFTNLNIKNIHKSNQVNERFILFKKLWPIINQKQFLPGVQGGFFHISDQSKFKIYTALVNNRKLRNSINAQRNLFDGIDIVWGEDFLESFDILISKESVGSNQITNYLNKNFRIFTTISKLKSFKTIDFKGISEKDKIKNLISSSENLEVSYEKLRKKLNDLVKSELDILSNKEIEELSKDDELLHKVIKLNSHYKDKEKTHHNVYIDGLKNFLNSTHSEFKYEDLYKLLKKYGENTNLNKTLIEKWIKTMKYVRYPKSTQNIDPKSIISRVNHIKISLTGQRIRKSKFDSITSLVEKLEKILYKLNSKDIQKRHEVITSLKKIRSELDKSQDLHLINIINSILTDINSVSSYTYVLTDEFNFNESHDIGERFGSCQSWTSPGSANLGLVATINDGTKKYIILKDKVTKAWNARGIIHLALKKNGERREFVLVLDNYKYNSHPEQEKFIQEFAENKAKYLKIPFIDAANSTQKEKNNLIIFGKSPSFYSDNGLTSSGMALKNQKNVDSL